MVCMCICMVCVYIRMYFCFRNCAFDRGNLDFVIVTLPISSGIIMHIVYMNIYIYIFM